MPRHEHIARLIHRRIGDRIDTVGEIYGVTGHADPLGRRRGVKRRHNHVAVLHRRTVVLQQNRTWRVRFDAARRRRTGYLHISMQNHAIQGDRRPCVAHLLVAIPLRSMEFDLIGLPFSGRQTGVG